VDPEFVQKVQRTAIVGLFADDELMSRLVLKGGNAIDLIYGSAMRSSLDLDFSIEGEFDSLDALEASLRRSLEAAFAEIGYVVFDLKVENQPPKISEDLKDFWGGYLATFKLIDLDSWLRYQHDLTQARKRAAAVSPTDSRTFRIDISRHEATVGKVARHLEGYTIFVYSPSMIAAEKLRALCQHLPEYSAIIRRTHAPARRGRDFVDIYELCRLHYVRFDSPEFAATVERMFAAKRVPLRFLTLVGRDRDHHRLDFDKIKDTVRPDFDVKPFDEYVDFVVAQCELLKPLWEVEPP
jgi:predicted nucleotidyltransferase component of viral defense system